MSQLGDFSVAPVFLMGILSFASPCILPTVPGYISYLAGITPQDPASAKYRSKFLRQHSFFYVLGFSLFLIPLGAGAGALGQVLVPYLPFLRFIAGIILLIHGLTMLLEYVVPWSWFSQLSHLWISKPKAFVDSDPLKPSIHRSILAGVSFARTPCVIPLFVSVLALAAVQATFARGTLLLIFYSLGLSIPFLFLGLSLNNAVSIIRRLNPYTPFLRIVGGVLLLILGVLMFRNALN